MDIDVDPELFYEGGDSSLHTRLPQRERYTIFIPGRQGCGKSVAASDFIEEFMPPQTVVYLFSTQGVEESYRFKNLTRKMKMDPKILAGVTKERIRTNAAGRPIMCLFDDVDMLPNAVAKPILALIEDLLANGRSHGPSEEHINMIITSHSPNDYHRTKKLLENCTYIVFFPRGLLRRQLELLMQKCGIGKEQADLICSLPQRRVLFRNVEPFRLIKF